METKDIIYTILSIFLIAIWTLSGIALIYYIRLKKELAKTQDELLKLTNKLLDYVHK